MPKGYGYNKRDENEPPILEVADRAGYVNFESVVRDKSAIGAFGFYMKLSKDDACDTLFGDEHGLFLVEIKNANLSPSKCQLTAREKILQHLCMAFGIPYHVVETPERMVEILNERKRT